VLAAAGGRGEPGVVRLPRGRWGGVGVELGAVVQRGVGVAGCRRRRGRRAADAHLEGHAGLLVAGDRALAGQRPGDRAEVQRGRAAGLQVWRLRPAADRQVVRDLALVDHVQRHRRAGRDLDDVGDDRHLLEHDLERLRRPQRVLGGRRGGRGTGGLQLPDPPPNSAELHDHHEQRDDQHADDEAEHDLLEGEGGLVLCATRGPTRGRHGSSLPSATRFGVAGPGREGRGSPVREDHRRWLAFQRPSR
jgi:hypothetical protein